MKRYLSVLNTTGQRLSLEFLLCVYFFLNTEMCDVTCPWPRGKSLKFTAQELYPHGDAVHPASGDDADEAGKDRWVDVVFHVVVVVCVPQESLQ